MGENMRETAVLQRVKQGYTTGARTLASRSIVGLARTRVTPNALTTAGVSLCLAAAVVVYFEDHDKLLFYWLGAFVFVVGSILDILDGALARAGGKTTPFGSFLDSTTDRVGEGAMLGAIALIFARPRQRGRARRDDRGDRGIVPRQLHAREGGGTRPPRRRRLRLAGRARRRDHGRPRAGAMGRLAMGDLSADGHGLVDGSPADPARRGRSCVGAASPKIHSCCSSSSAWSSGAGFP